MIRRSLPPYLIVLGLTILLGLASRRYAHNLPPLPAQYAGDVLWASMIFWWGALFFRRAQTLPIALGAFTVCVLVELSQLYRAPFINAIRDTALGALVLGQGFLWSDLVCYAFGVALAALIDWLWTRLSRPLREPGSRASDGN